ncbi:MAG: gfo/Idh/MocA family oxidoreductase [Planctomycetaceae bacterium]|nr:MAG: gfo/Idh/MocA family oxidoreductase [Planctomycetaceae bacterium]
MTTISQIGVGYWGPNLLRNLIANKDCSVKSVVDISGDRRDFVKDLYPRVRVTGNVDDILSDPEIDAVVIATPVAEHFDLAMKALAAGKHILVEKPMATSVEEVEQIGEAARQKNLIAMVGHTFLFNPAVHYVKKLIDSGEIGDIRYIYSQRINLGRIRSDVDALWNLGPHDISIIQYWLGEPSPISVTRHGMSYVQESIEDVVFLNITYPNKIMVNIHLSWLDPHKIRRMTVVGSKKMVIYDDIAENKITICDKGIDRLSVLGEHMDFDDPRSFSFNHRNGDIVLPKIDFKEPLKLEIEHFLDCIQNGTECLTGVEHAKKVISILSKATVGGQ